ncbi:MAG: sugar transferase [Pseudomonadota bacterium]
MAAVSCRQLGGLGDFVVSETGNALRQLSLPGEALVEASPVDAASTSSEGNSLGREPASAPEKRLLDIAIASGALVFFAPLLLVLFFLVRRDGGPAIFVQERVGKDGKLFPCYKFRSMVPDAETRLRDLLVCNEFFRKDWEANRKLKNDPRITKLGAFLRRKSLDELPQLLNVLRGEMSIVGPRPITPDETEKYGEDIKFYVRARPGLTGAWQVSGRNDVSYEERVVLDVQYTTSWTFVNDLLIILRTFNAVLKERGAL